MAIINSQIQSDLLKKAEQGIESKLSPNIKDDYMRIFNAGMAMAMRGEKKSPMASLKNSKDPMKDVVEGVVGLLGLLRRESKNNMPIMPMMMAGETLVLQGLDFAERVGAMKVGNAEIDKATLMFTASISQRLGVPPEKMKAMVQQVHAMMNDPAQLEKLKQAHAMDEQKKQRNQDTKQALSEIPIRGGLGVLRRGNLGA